MKSNNINLSFFVQAPELTVKAKMTITALAPLSMVSSQPGSYFRSESVPTESMLYGMLENALGWHFFDDAKKNNLRTIIGTGLKKAAKKVNKKNTDYKEYDWLKSKKFAQAESGFKSLLQYHVKFQLSEIPKIKVSYDDLWSMSNRTDGDSFIGGSRNYDVSLENMMNLSKAQDKSKPVNKKTKKHPPFISFGDKAEFVTYSLNELLALKEGKAKTTSLKPHFPMYYSSPKKRGYVIPEKPYVFTVECTTEAAELLEQAISEPQAPLYLGSNDGWVDVKWEKL